MPDSQFINRVEVLCFQLSCISSESVESGFSKESRNQLGETGLQTNTQSKEVTKMLHRERMSSQTHFIYNEILEL